MQPEYFHSLLRLIVCINQRIEKQSCAGSGNLGYIGEIKAMLAQQGLDVPVVERECLGKCEEGPVMRIAPGGKFFTKINRRSLQLVIDELKVVLAKQPDGPG